MSTLIPIGKAAKSIGVTVHTLQKWDRDGKLVAHRSQTNQRYYTQEQIAQFKGLPANSGQRIIAYCRVSSPAQKPDLKNQRETLEQFSAARGLAGVEFIAEVGGGLNLERKQFLAILDAVSDRCVKTLILAHQDRLTRFGFAWFERFCQRHGCEVLVLNQERLSPEAEMVEDLMTILDCFSSRLEGLRNYKQKLKVALEEQQDGSEGSQN